MNKIYHRVRKCILLVNDTFLGMINGRKMNHIKVKGKNKHKTGHEGP
jgi:hypothetical protein